MTYTFELDRDNGKWAAYNPNGQKIATGDLPLTDTDRKTAIIEDKGVSDPVKDALRAVFIEDWEMIEFEAE